MSISYACKLGILFETKERGTEAKRVESKVPGIFMRWHTRHPKLQISTPVLQGAPRVTSGARRYGDWMCSVRCRSTQEAKGRRRRLAVRFRSTERDGHCLNQEHTQTPKSMILTWIFSISEINGVGMTSRRGLPRESAVSVESAAICFLSDSGNVLGEVRKR